MGIVAVVLALLIAAGPPGPADATGIKVTGDNPGHLHTFPNSVHRHAPRARQLHRFPNAIHRQAPAVDRIDRHPNIIHRHGPVIVVPQPVFVISPRRCAVPGYWAYSWIPQSYVANVWVPGHYNADALWVEGHWAPRAYAWGYYQPYWVPESWTYC